MPIQDAIDAFQQHYRQAFKTVDYEFASLNRMVELHPSSFPYCGLKHAYKRLVNGEEISHETNLFSSFFMSVGTTVHTVMQEWVSKVIHRYSEAGTPHELKGDVIGFWKCTNSECGLWRKKPTTYKDCRKCGSSMEYHELGVKFGRYITGHLDGIMILGSMEEAFVFDYKTCSSYAIQQHRMKGNKFPYMYNVKQIESYCALVTHLYPGIKVKGWMLVYCFHPDTLLYSESGKVRIEDYTSDPDRYGKLLSYDNDTGDTRWSDVTHVSVAPNSREMIKLEYEGGSITVTTDHPIWSVTRNAYIAAGDMQEGEDVLVVD